MRLKSHSKMTMPDFWERQFLRYELLLGMAGSAAFAYWCQRRNGLAIIEPILHGNRAAVYGTLASILGALLGFAITTISIVIAFSGERRLQMLAKTKHYQSLWRVLTSAVRWFGLATIAALSALLLDRDDRTAPIILYVCVLTLVLSLMRLTRSIWVLERLISILTKPRH
jgi:hypothetical protein